MSRRLDDLDPAFRAVVCELIARAIEALIPVRIISTGRTREEQDAYIASGVSWRRDSLHLRGLAIDVCPCELLERKGWDPASPLWQRLGLIGEALGLVWGGRWRQRDMGHFEARKGATHGNSGSIEPERRGADPPRRAASRSRGR